MYRLAYKMADANGEYWVYLCVTKGRLLSLSNARETIYPDDATKKYFVYTTIEQANVAKTKVQTRFPNIQVVKH